MERILQYKNKTLVKKYDRYYIRFVGGQYIELPCDILITEEEASKIVANQALMDDIFKAYKSKMPWTVETFVQSGLMGFLMNEGKYTSEESKEILAKLKKYEDLKYEMYETGITGEYPKNSPIKVGDITAEMIAKQQQKSSCRAYVELLDLMANSQ